MAGQMRCRYSTPAISFWAKATSFQLCPMNSQISSAAGARNNVDTRTILAASESLPLTN